MLNLEPIQNRLAAAPPGPWKHCPVRRMLLARDGKEIDVFAVHSIPESPALELVLHATADMSALLEEIGEARRLRLRAEADAARARIDISMLQSALTELLRAVSKGSAEDINITMVAAEELLEDKNA